MPWIAALAASAYGAYNQKNSAKKAAGKQDQLAMQQRQWALDDRAPWLQKLMPAIDAEQARGDLISGALTSRSYDFFNKGLTETEGTQRTKLLQGLARRGVDATPERLARAEGDFGSRFADIRTGKGLELARDAATTNAAHRMAILQALNSGYGQTQGQVGQANMGATAGLMDSNSATLAANNNFWSQIAGAVGSAAGGAYNSYQDSKNPYAYTASKYGKGAPMTPLKLPPPKPLSYPDWSWAPR